MNFIKITLTVILFTILSSSGFSQNNVTITDISSHDAHTSAMLDVHSTTKGMLVPRMSNIQMGLISEPATGLLIFNTNFNSFYFYNGTIWVDLSSGTSSFWNINPVSGDVYLDNLNSNIGIGTNHPESKLTVSANIGADPDEPLFEILDEEGFPIFSVTSEGVRVYVKENVGKGVSGGFAVGRYGTAKGIPDTTFLLVTPDSTRIYVNETTKAVSGGFAVGRYGTAKGNANFMHLTENNCIIGHGSGSSLEDGAFNIFLGYKSGISTSGGSNNLYIGNHSGRDNQNGINNIYIGEACGAENPSGINNTYIGYYAGNKNTGSNNIFIGYESGMTSSVSNRLIIDNTDDPQPLFWGDLENNRLVINGNDEDNPQTRTLQVNGTAGGIEDWSTVSDKREKKNIETIPNALDKVLKLRGVNFEWKDLEKHTKGKRMGFIAQEAFDVIPEVVQKGNDQYSMQYSSITSVLVEAVKEQQTMINDLKSENEDLKDQINEIKLLLEKN